MSQRCQCPSAHAEERTIGDAIFLDINSQKARDKIINLMNEEGKELTVDFVMNQLEIEDCNSHHKSLSLLDSTTSVNLFCMTIGKTRETRTRKMCEMENHRHRIILESRDLQILDISLENPQEWRTSA